MRVFLGGESKGFSSPGHRRDIKKLQGNLGQKRQGNWWKKYRKTVADWMIFLVFYQISYCTLYQPPTGEPD